MGKLTVGGNRMLENLPWESGLLGEIECWTIYHEKADCWRKYNVV